VVTVTTGPDTHIINSGTNPGDPTPTLNMTPGITAESGSLAAAGGKITANVASTIDMFGKATADASFLNNPVALRSIARADAPILVNYTGAGITTSGGGGIGILAESNGPATSAVPGSGSVTINSSGPINTNGTGALGIVADSGQLRNNSNGRPSQPGGDVMVTALGAISTQGDVSHGIWANSTTGNVQVTATNVSTPGQFSVGINAASPGINGTGGGNVMVSIPSGGSVMGGWQPGLWQPGLSGTGSDPTGNFGGLPSAGVVLSSAGGTATLTNDGTIGALSDRAVAGDPQVINNGLITGFVQFTGGNNSITNNGTFDLRHFAQTTPNGGRDTLRVAIADLGDGPGNSFTNNGTLRLPAVIGATTLDSTGQYLPLGNPNNLMALGGPLQGHLIGVQTFTNSGIIDLQSNPVAGDVLVITGARQAGVAGPGTYISNGGTLKLDTVLNQGDVATRSDTLVVDGTMVGGNGATKMAIRNARAGAEALTVNDGILVVEVKNPARSASGAFSLVGGFITAGAFDYFLFKGGASPGSQGNWYLRNELIAPPIGSPTPTPEPAPGSPPLPTVVPGEAPIPLFDPEVPLKSVVPSVARTLGLITLGTFNERQGDQLLVRGDPNTWVGAWGRVFGQQTREHFAEGARPDFDGTFAGFQAGADLLRLESLSGHSDRIGFYVAQARASGAVHGSVDGFDGAPAGHVDLDATSFGGYWTHLGPSNWYIDAVLQGTYFQTAANSIRGVANNFSGRGFAASIEGGYPIPLMSWLTFEPQIQGIWQRTSFDDSLGEGFSTITYDRSNVFTGRAGVLLRGTFGSTGAVWQPYLKGNVWWGSNGVDTVRFDADPIQTRRNGGTTLEGGGGVTGKLTRNVSVYGDASYLESVSGEQRITLKGNVGARVTW
jgi:outer membrane autotransporter protein